MTRAGTKTAGRRFGPGASPSAVHAFPRWQVAGIKSAVICSSLRYARRHQSQQQTAFERGAGVSGEQFQGVLGWDYSVLTTS